VGDKIRKRKKADASHIGFQDNFHHFRRLFSVSFFKSSDTSSANVTVRFLTVFYVIDFLYVYLESSSRLTVGVAYVVTGCLTFTANVTYSGHIKHLHFGLFFRGFRRLSDTRFSFKSYIRKNKHK
jgi:hypothetical protein